MPKSPARTDLPNLRLLTTKWRVERDDEGVSMIPGRYGWVEPHDTKTLAVCLFRARGLNAWISKLPLHWRRWQVGDQDARLLLPIKELDQAAETVKAYRRRVVSAALRAELVRRLARIRPEARTLAA